jgi:hypothetical protein
MRWTTAIRVVWFFRMGRRLLSAIAPPALPESRTPSPPRTNGRVEVLAAMTALIAPTLVSILADAIREGTHDRVRDLRVELDGVGVVVRGRAASYYVKQLAHRAALGVLEGGRLFNEIQVGPAARRHARPAGALA